MRQIISISLPSEDVIEIKKNAQKRGFSSLSSYFRHLFVADKEDIISEAELIKIIERSNREYKEGKYIVANSIRDLL